MPEYDGLTGRTGEKASDLFSRSKTAFAGEAPNHRPNDLALACPLCRNQGNTQNRMFSRPNAGYYCMAGHKWNDIDELMAMRPDKLAFQGIKARQEGYKPVTFEMPGSTVDALQAKFGDKLATTLAGFMDMLVQERILIVGEEDVVRVEQNLGREIRNGRDLAGATYERAEKIKELQESLEKRPEGTSSAGGFDIPGVVMINVIDILDKLTDKAKNGDPPNRSVSQYLTDTIHEFVKNDWI